MNKKTELLSLSHPNVFDQAAAVIQAGGVVAFPTDTVYGIGVSPFDEKGIEKIFDVKGRSHLKAISYSGWRCRGFSSDHTANSPIHPTNHR